MWPLTRGMFHHRLTLIIAGIAATAVIAVAGSWGATLRGAPVGWLQLLLMLEATQFAGLGLGWLAFRGRA